jgi:hypothetical protein
MRRQGISPKLQPMYIGPCLITKKMNDINNQIQVNGLGSSKVVGPIYIGCNLGLIP